MQGSLVSDSALFYFADTLQVRDSVKVNVDSAEIKMKLLAEGKNLYENKCGKCHALNEADEYSAKEWKKILKVMSIKAELNFSENNKIKLFLFENAADN